MAKKENWVDYKTIKEQVSMQMVLDKYGIINTAAKYTKYYLFML
jgi:hypothetical protein